MKIEDVMSRDVVTVRPDTPLKDVARELVERGISGMPVVDADGRVVGVISEADVVAKERGPSPKRGGALAQLMGRGAPAEDLKSQAQVAGEAMTSPAVTIEPYRSVATAAGQMLDRGINRLPVVSDGRLLGIVTRADLVRAFSRSDEEVARDVREGVAQAAVWLEEDEVEVRFQDGEAVLTGRVRSHGDAETLCAIAAGVPGVVSVRSELGSPGES